MNGEDFAALRRKAGMTQAAAAEQLGVTARTVASWERSGETKTFPTIEAATIRDLYVPSVLDGRLESIAEDVFQRLPCELVAIWIVHRPYCTLRPAGVRRQALGTDGGELPPSPVCTVSLTDVSLTTYPLRTGETLNLSGEDIVRHEAKKYKTLAASHFEGGRCESLLHVPSFRPSSSGPIPIGLLSLENRLDADGRVRIAEPGQRGLRLFTANDQLAVESMAKDIWDEQLIEELRLLDML